MLSIVQLVERQFVALEVVGSILTTQPYIFNIKTHTAIFYFTNFIFTENIEVLREDIENFSVLSKIHSFYFWTGISVGPFLLKGEKYEKFI